jgi:beta-glucosidase
MRYFALLTVTLVMVTGCCCLEPDKDDPTIPRAGTGEMWWDLHAQYVAEAAQNDSASVVFFGDSITYLMTIGTVPELNNQTYGKKYWDQYFVPLDALNFGIGGDTTNNVLWRLSNGEFPATFKPKGAVVLIGTNNVPTDATAEKIAEAIAYIVNEIREKSPTTKVLLLDILPRGAEGTSDTIKYRMLIATINNYLHGFVDGQTLFSLPTWPIFLDSAGHCRPELFANDGSVNLHPNEAGYALLLAAIQDRLREIGVIQ